MSGRVSAERIPKKERIMAGGFFSDFTGNLSSGWNKLTSLKIGEMNRWEEWAALAVTTAVTIGILSMLFNMIKSFWEENKSLIIMIGLVALAVVGIPWLMSKFGGKGEVQEATAREPARRSTPDPFASDEATPDLQGSRRPALLHRGSFDGDEVSAAPAINSAIFNSNIQFGGVTHADLLPQHSLNDGLPAEIALLQARERAADQVAGRVAV